MIFFEISPGGQRKLSIVFLATAKTMLQNIWFSDSGKYKKNKGLSDA